MVDDAAPHDEVTRLPLRVLGLKPGMALQTRRLAQGATKREAQYFGAIEGKGVMVGPIGPDADPTELKVGDICLVRGFTGQYEYSFPSKVLQTFEKPFVYALLAYPAQVDAKLVRQSMRVKRDCPTELKVDGTDGTPKTVAVTLIDISPHGAMVKTDSHLAAVGTVVQVSLTIPVDGLPIQLHLAATVCHNNRATYEDNYFLGMAFKGISAGDKALLNDLVQQA